MTLLVDAGHSTIKLAMRDDRGGIVWLTSLSCTGEPAADRLTEWLAQQRERAPMLVSNVLGESFADGVTDWCVRNGWPGPKFVAVTQEVGGLRVGYQDPRQLGVDRFVAMLGALQVARPPFVLADCGTAVTIDAVDADGQHRGGVILPGVRSMRDALAAGVGLSAAGVPCLFANNTGDGIAGGIHYGLAGAIDRIADDMADAIGAPRCLLTGGDAKALQPFLVRDWVIDPMLVMRGLAILAGEG